jgi:predicted phosphodiesterase
MSIRLLALSDIHNNVPCVRKLRAQEENAFDALVVAGDIGGHRTEEIFGVLRSFGCPIVYVYGNWDHELARDDDFGRDAHLLHLNVIRIGSINFTGFSEFRSERDPHPRAVLETRGEYYRRQAELLSLYLRESKVELGHTVLITHERLTRLGTRFPALLLHVFGHNHGFDFSHVRETKCANVSALDRMLPVLPTIARRRSQSLRYVNAGNYAVIDIGKSGEIQIECRFLPHDYEAWAVVRRNVSDFGGVLVPEETAFGDNVRFTR